MEQTEKKYLLAKNKARKYKKLKKQAIKMLFKACIIILGLIILCKIINYVIELDNKKMLIPSYEYSLYLQMNK